MTRALPRVWLKQGREKSLRRGHPWVFSGAIERIEGSPAAGATVNLLSSQDEWLAPAAYSPSSQIRARVWTFDEAESVDAEFFRRRLLRAIESRRTLRLLDRETACRLVFAESDGLPGFIVDRYGDYLSCQFLAAGVDAWRTTLGDLLVELCSPSGVFERSEGGSRHKEGLPSRRGVLAGAAPPSELTVDVGGVRLMIDIASGQKTGGYLDQRENRPRVAAHANGADVLDAFSYTGGFAITCLKAGGRSATLVDASTEALALAERETEANGVRGVCRFVTADVFEELRELRRAGRQFDLVVLDPPKCVHSAEQLSAGSRGYKDINMLGLALVRPGGVLATVSCSGHVDATLFQQSVAGAALDASRGAQILERLSQPADHPVAIEFPEGEYLKGLIMRVH